MYQQNLHFQLLYINYKHGKAKYPDREFQLIKYNTEGIFILF